MSNPAPKREITVIPIKTEQNVDNVLSPEAYYKKKVTAYARVSTDDEEQKTSYDAQLDYYSRLIKANDEWEYVEIYTDEGISGTNTKKRKGFNQMVKDALAGKIDLILTKSVSRFARNTVDTLTTVRKLKEHGVEIYFEKENIYTLDSKGELLITIMGSLAQEESRSISENVTWGKRKRLADGKFTLPYKRFLGYRKGPDGLPEIEEEEAVIIRLIYRLFLYGKSTSAIASMLSNEGILTPGGKVRWRAKTVESILSNEKYKGDALLQKRFTVDFLTKKTKINTGEVPQYYVKDSHPAIIEREMFDLVQWEMKRRKAEGAYASCANPFSGKLICGDCGGMFGHKVRHKNTPYRKLQWYCNNQYQGAGCATSHFSEEEIKAAFLEAFNQQLRHRGDIIATYRDIAKVLTDTSALDVEEADLTSECDVVMEMSNRLVDENATTAMDQEEYTRRFEGLVSRYDRLQARLAEIHDTRLASTAKRVGIERFVDALDRSNELVTDFDEELWYTTVDTVTVMADKRLVFNFKNGTAVNVDPEVRRM